MPLDGIQYEMCRISTDFTGHWLGNTQLRGFVNFDAHKRSNSTEMKDSRNREALSIHIAPFSLLTYGIFTGIFQGCFVLGTTIYSLLFIDECRGWRRGCVHSCVEDIRTGGGVCCIVLQQIRAIPTTTVEAIDTPHNLLLATCCLTSSQTSVLIKAIRRKVRER